MLRRSRTLLGMSMVAAIAAACGGGDEEASNPSTPRAGGGGKAGAGGKSGAAGQGGAAGVAGSKGGAAGQGGSVQVQVVSSLKISPPTATLQVVQGQPVPSTTFTVLPVYSDGTTGKPIPEAVWSFDTDDLAAVKSGVVTATGQRGGVGKVSATLKDKKAEATVEVKLTLTSDAGLTPADKDALAKAPMGLGLMYPYDGTVFPLDIAPPMLMWSGAAPGDKVQVELSHKYATMQSFVVDASGSGQHTPDAALWTKLTETARGSKVAVRVARLGANGVAQATTQTWSFATGGLHGSVYYWANNKGRILRIRPGAPQPAPEDFLADKAPGCTTCHTVSARGNVLAMQRRNPYPPPPGQTSGENTCAETAAIYDLSTQSMRSELTAASACDPATGAVSAWNRYFAFPALNAQGDVLVQMSVVGAYDTVTNQPIDTGLTKGLQYPAFAADDQLLSFVEGTGDVRVFEWNNTTRKVGAERLLVPNSADPARSWASYTTLSPDHRSVVYGRGDYGASYISPGALPSNPADSGVTLPATVDLYLAPTDKENSGEIALTQLNGTTYPFAAGDRDRHRNYEPTFAPIAVGGYLWVVFTSRRTYGNLLTSPDAMATKQLWIAAIDLDPKPGQDPSHPAFWLPGQDLKDLNMRGFWALDPCKADGGGCDGGDECCGGYCRASDPNDPQSPKTCFSTGSPGNQCSGVSEKCASSADCCNAKDGVKCVGGFCAEPAPPIE